MTEICKHCDATVLSSLSRPAQRSPHGVETIRTAAKALDYLADHTRPPGGQSTYNAEHLIQLAYELREIANGSAVTSTECGGGK